LSTQQNLKLGNEVPWNVIDAKTRGDWSQVLDLYARKIMGWVMALSMPAERVFGLAHGYLSAPVVMGSDGPF
jgi:transposase InsO family protein